MAKNRLKRGPKPLVKRIRDQLRHPTLKEMERGLKTRPYSGPKTGSLATDQQSSPVYVPPKRKGATTNDVDGSLTR